jgi:hypothetical protein
LSGFHYKKGYVPYYHFVFPSVFLSIRWILKKPPYFVLYLYLGN